MAQWKRRGFYSPRNVKQHNAYIYRMATQHAFILHRTGNCKHISPKLTAEARTSMIGGMVFTAESVYEEETGNEVKGVAVYVNRHPFFHICEQSFTMQLKKLYPKVEVGFHSKKQLQDTMVQFAQTMAIRN